MIIFVLILSGIGLGAISLSKGLLRKVSIVLVGLLIAVMVAGIVIKSVETVKVNNIRKEYDVSDEFSFSNLGETDEYYKVRMSSITDYTYLLVPKADAEMEPLPSFDIPLVVFCEKGQSYYGIPVENDTLDVDGQKYYVDNSIRKMIPDYGALGVMVTVIGSALCVPVNAVLLIVAAAVRTKKKSES